MEDNPYSKLVSLLKPPDNQLTLYRGEIVKISPLTISVGSITVSGNELMVNASMLKYNADISIPNFSGSAGITPALSIGDTVLLLTVDDQLFYVLCKVVRV